MKIHRRLLYLVCSIFILSTPACSSEEKSSATSPTRIDWNTFFIGKTWTSDQTIRVMVATDWDENLNPILQEVGKHIEYRIYSDGTLSIDMPRTYDDSTYCCCIGDWTLSESTQVLTVDWDPYLPQPCRGVQTAQLSALADGGLRISSIAGNGSGLVGDTFYSGRNPVQD